MVRRKFLITTILSGIGFSCRKAVMLLSNSGSVDNISQSPNYLLFNSYGQSLSIGGAGGKQSTVSSINPEYDSVMPNLGVRSLDYVTKPTSFIPLKEALSPDGKLGETLCSGTCKAFTEAYPTKPYKLSAIASGYGGQTVANLSKGTTKYQRLIRDISNSNSISISEGKSLNVGCVGWTQGEADYTAGTPYEDYKASVLTLFSNITHDVKNITRQASDNIFVIGQTSSHNNHTNSIYNPYVALAQLGIAINTPNATLAAPMYMFDFLDDNTHLPSQYYRILGGYYGYAMKKLLIDGTKNFIYPLSITTNSYNIFIKFNVPVAPLVFDTVSVVNPGNYGFSIRNSSNVKIPIKLTTIYKPDTIKITCNSSFIGGTISYGINGMINKAGRTQGGRGCLRDSQGNKVKFDSWDLHNWCPVFKSTLP